jgi:leucyl aminopeptidase
MKFSTVQTPDQRKAADLFVIPLFTVKGKVEWPHGLDGKKAGYDAALKTGDFKATEGELSLQYAPKGKEARVLLLGLGDVDHATVETLRRAFSAVIKTTSTYKLKTANILVPKIQALSEEEILRGMTEGLLLSNYAYIGQKADAKPTLLEQICFITSAKNALKVAAKALVICEGVYFARDLVNGNADDITPSYLAQAANTIAKKYPKIKTTIFDKKRLEKEGFGLILAVSQGSHIPPALIVVEYKGNPKDKKATVLIGKGVTYDTGGLNLKPTGSMETMKCDMGGAAAVLATLQVAAALGLKRNITVVIPSVENSISSTSYKPGDVYKSYSGKTVEIGNTDAEGRLILADAIAYAVKKLHPSEIVDVATLTGAIEVALGNECTGLFCNQDVLADAILRSGRITFERVWRMPIFEEYREQLRSEISDICNHGGRPGGAITAALFLKEFVGKDIPWAHLDIAGTAYLKDRKRYHPKYATGIGVRLLIEMIENL